MRLDISENNIIPNVTRWLILTCQVKYEKYGDLPGFDTSVLNRLSGILLWSVPGVRHG